MGPKKKDKKDDGDGEEGGGKKGGGDDTLDRDILLVEINAVRAKLKRSEEKAQLLEAENKELQASMTRQRDEQVDIFKFLNEQLLHRTLKNEAFEHQLAEAEMQANVQRELFENELKAERASNEEMTRKLNEKISNFEAKFVDLNEFIEKKDSLHAELKEAQDRLIKEQKEHTVIVNDLERKAVQEKERLRKEMLAKIKEAKNQFMKMTGNRLEVTTKRTIMENEQMNSELAFQSREAEKLLHKNEQLTLENKTMKRDLELYRQMEKELAKRNNAYLKTIRTLLSKLKALDATKKDILETGKRKEADILDLYQSQIANISMNLDESTMELDELRSKYSETSEKLKQITSMHDEVMRFMIQCLEDVKVQLSKPRTEADRLIEELVPELSTPLTGLGLRTSQQGAARLDELGPAEREKILQYLISKLRALAVASSSPPRQAADNRTTSLPPIFAERPLNMSLNGIDLSAPLREINNFLQGSSFSGGERSFDDNIRGQSNAAAEARPWGQKSKNPSGKAR